MGLFGDLYDFNGDGKLDALESATEFSAFMNLIDSEEEENEDNSEKNFKEDNYEF